MLRKIVYGILILLAVLLLGYLLVIWLTPRSSNNQPTPQTQTGGIFYPMTNYNQRLTFRPFGKEVSPSDKPSPCGQSFSGFHTADDLEILPGETDAAVPFYAIADGTVVRKETASGYGGLLVVLQSISGQIVTTYYGHVDLDTIALKVNDAVKGGQKLGNLAPACSVKSGGERKHLHFGIHKGDQIDIRGYVPTQAELANWLNPKDFLAENKANQIK